MRGRIPSCRLPLSRGEDNGRERPDGSRRQRPRCSRRHAARRVLQPPLAAAARGRELCRAGVCARPPRRFRRPLPADNRHCRLRRRAGPQFARPDAPGNRDHPPPHSRHGADFGGSHRYPGRRFQRAVHPRREFARTAICAIRRTCSLSPPAEPSTSRFFRPPRCRWDGRRSRCTGSARRRRQSRCISGRRVRTGRPWRHSPANRRRTGGIFSGIGRRRCARERGWP